MEVAIYLGIYDIAFARDKRLKELQHPLDRCLAHRDVYVYLQICDCNPLLLSDSPARKLHFLLVSIATLLVVPELLATSPCIPLQHAYPLPSPLVSTPELRISYRLHRQSICDPEI